MKLKYLGSRRNQKQTIYLGLEVSNVHTGFFQPFLLVITIENQDHRHRHCIIIIILVTKKGVGALATRALWPKGLLLGCVSRVSSGLPLS